MTDVGNIPYISYLVTQFFQIAEKDVESDCRTGVTQVRITINRRTANVHTHMRFVQWDELFLFSCECVINAYWMFHIYLYLRGANLQ